MRRYLPFAVVLLACSTSAADTPDSATQSRARVPESASASAGGAVARDTSSASRRRQFGAASGPTRFCGGPADHPRALRESVRRTEPQANAQADRHRGLDRDQRVRHRCEGRVRAQHPVRRPMLQKNAGHGGRDPRTCSALVDTLKAHGILPIARIVVFKDSVAARVNPEHDDPEARRLAVARQAGPHVGESVRRTRSGSTTSASPRRRCGSGSARSSSITSGSPSRTRACRRRCSRTRRAGPSREVLARVSEGGERAARQARRPDDGRHLRSRDDGGRRAGDRPGVGEGLAGGRTWCCRWRIRRTIRAGAFGIARPNADPYKIQQVAIARARAARREARNHGRATCGRGFRRFRLAQPKYDASHVKDQMRGIYDAGYNGWVWWHPGSLYEPFLPALEKTLVPRAKNP